MKKMFEYLDRYYLKNENKKNLTEFSLQLWKDKIFMSRMTDLRVAILTEITKDRENEIVDKELIKEAVF